jgi:hypothetical protein
MKTLQKFGGIRRAVPGSRLPDWNGDLSRRSGLPQHHRPGPKGGPARRETDGHLFDQPAHVRVLWRFLIVLSLALYDRLKTGAPAMMQVATAIGIIWAGSLIASGMVANAGIAPVVALYAKDPAQAALDLAGN